MNFKNIRHSQNTKILQSTDMTENLFWKLINFCQLATQQLHITDKMDDESEFEFSEDFYDEEDLSDVECENEDTAENQLQRNLLQFPNH